jgi:hypothetical protein
MVGEIFKHFITQLLHWYTSLAGGDEAEGNKYPIAKTGISASFNVENSRREADMKTNTEMIGYLLKKSPCCTTISYRYIDEIDDNKFMYPLYKNVPMAAFQIIYSARSGLQCAVVGSGDIGKLCDIVTDTLGLSDGVVNFVHEGLVNTLSLGNSIKKLTEKSRLEDNELMLFQPADLPLFYSAFPYLSDKKIPNHAFIYYLNALETIFPDKKLFERNFYDVVEDVPHGRRYHLKEANIFSFTNRVADQLVDIADTFYTDRKGGRQIQAMRQVLVEKMLEHPVDVAVVLPSLARYRTRRRRNEQEQHPLNLAYLDIIGHILANSGSSKNGVAVSFNTDPFALRDVDGSPVPDFTYYRKIFDTVGEDGLEKIIPYADDIKKLNRAIEAHKREFHILQDFPGFLNEKVRRLNLSYKEDFGQIDNKRIEERTSLGLLTANELKIIENNQIPMPFDASGTLVMPLAPGDDIEGTIQYLEQKRFLLKGQQQAYAKLRGPQT